MYDKTTDSWVVLNRTQNNQFVRSNAGIGPYKFRLKSKMGEEIVEDKVPLLSGGNYIGQRQFKRAPIRSVKTRQNIKI